MRNIKTRYLWISVAVSFLLAVGLIIGVTQTKGAWTQVFIVLIAIVFIYMTIAIQMASVKSFRYKPKPKNYPTKSYLYLAEDMDENLQKKGYKPRVTPYGISYLKVDKTNAYKIVLVRNCEKYFNQDEEQNNSIPPNKSLEKCKKFIGFEIFYDYDEDTLRKIPDFNLQGNNVYYSGLYIEDNKITCPNYIEPTEDFSNLYEAIKSDLMLKDIEPSIDNVLEKNE
ncbi:MAG: hypothetical protein NC087_02575 [Anaeroplasma bactoclasticum]|nr:hypothetical protein [Anaeroplasma bactoclasticum]MCM1556401.1 hypothetical protein [Anaeroplasma bactoclasticum]